MANEKKHTSCDDCSDGTFESIAIQSNIIHVYTKEVVGELWQLGQPTNIEIGKLVYDVR